MKLGILGGTFDPVHLGHIHIAEAALGEYALDEVWFMPAGDPYFKDDTDVTDPFTRFDMTRYSLRGLDKPFTASDYEILRGGRTYTAETLMSLRAAYPEYELYFIMGRDSLEALKSWYRPEDILSSAVILTAPRKPDLEAAIYPAGDHMDGIIDELNKLYPAAHPDIRILHTDLLDISSSMIRDKIRAGEDISRLILHATYDYIVSHGLYI